MEDPRMYRLFRQGHRGPPGSYCAKGSSGGSTKHEAPLKMRFPMA